jgi:hypothetical protein
VSSSLPRTTAQSERVAGHLASCCGAVYESLGRCAPSLSNDALVVLAYETARTFGEIRSEFFELLAHRSRVDPLDVVRAVPVIGEVVERAVALDPTGSLALVSVATTIGPRLIISLRDASESASDAAEGPLRVRAQSSGQLLVAATYRVGEATRVVDGTDASMWRDALNEFDDLMTDAGFGESFGLGE